MAANDQQHKNIQDLREPAHHARRPMNAFLIFCKKHRSSVRKSFPNLENRAVTRVLGEWWATLGPEQKCDYTNLAQDYKDAFLNANPDFKWYKLPAPPLRTLTTRPRNKKSEIDVSEENLEDESNYDSINNEKTTTSEEDASIQPGKLADETQIGGLSSLFTPQKNSTEVEANKESKSQNLADNAPESPKKLYTDVPIDNEQRRKCTVDLFCNEKLNNTESNNNEHHQLNEEEKNETGEENNFRTERSCKGLRYQQLMAEQQRNVGAIGHQPKRRRPGTLNTHEERPKERRNSISSNVSEKTDSLSSEGANSTRSDLEHLVESAEGKLEASKPEETETEGAESHHNYSEWPSYKRFKAEDFNLEKKIEALPELSLEEFQGKKKQQRTKKKKITQKISSSVGKHNSLLQGHVSGDLPGTINEFIDSHEDSDKSLLVGSQKRKARKQSITRNTAATSVSKNDKNQTDNKPWCASPDLDALACLAEIAANRTKLTK
ncbi:HMG box transcription factor BBX [Venturia canescens]|uniref:HMG box transcription factor BBX n=1 Tax=Venturia canescens TaxID=32260 RepID=UPI001C9CFC80|nr:HMG box transcription factor BBX [Venturia canescens]